MRAVKSSTGGWFAPTTGPPCSRSRLCLLELSLSLSLSSPSRTGITIASAADIIASKLLPGVVPVALPLPLPPGLTRFVLGLAGGEEALPLLSENATLARRGVPGLVVRGLPLGVGAFKMDLGLEKTALPGDPTSPLRVRLSRMRASSVFLTGV